MRALRLPLVFLGALLVALACGEEARVVVGREGHLYAWDGGWARLPAGEVLGRTHGRVVVDAASRVYVETDTADAVRVFDADGTLLRSFGAELAGGLHGMALAREGDEEFLYLTHTAGRVVKATLEGEVVWTLGWPEESGLYERADQYHPTAVAVRSNGELYVADGYGKSYVHRYDAARRYLGSFGGRGEGTGRGPGELRNPHGLWIDESGPEPRLLVADRENGRIQLFDLEGEPLGAWSKGLRRPCTIHPYGPGWAVTDIDGKVTLLDPDGRPLAHLGENPDPAARDRDDVPAADLVAGRFVSPHGAYPAPDGSLFVVEWLEHGRLTRLVPLAAR